MFTMSLFHGIVEGFLLAAVFTLLYENRKLRNENKKRR